MDKLADNLVFLRKEKDFTQSDISEKLFVSRQAVSKWERGESIPDLDTLLALSRLYGVTVDELLTVDLSQESPEKRQVSENNFDEVKLLHKKQLAKKMVFVAVCLLGAYSLICGIIQTACFNIESNIWLIWFTLPIIPPLCFAICFRHDINKKFLMFFFNMPFVAGLIFEVIILEGNSDGAWIAFLMIPLYYVISLIVFFSMHIKQKHSK